METHSRQRRVEGFRLCISATYWPNATGSQLTGQTGKYSPAIVSPRTSLVAQMVKHLPTMLETWVRSLGQEDPLEKEMATHSSTLAWKLQEFPGGAWWATVHRVPRVRHDWATSLSLLAEPVPVSNSPVGNGQRWDWGQTWVCRRIESDQKAEKLL